jgi:hypothetical protein
MRIFKGQSRSVGDDWHFPQALAFASSGIRGKAVVSITHDKEIITGKHHLIHMLCAYTFSILE